MHERHPMTKRITKFWAALLALLLTIASPIAHAVTHVKEIITRALAPTPPPSTPEASPPPATGPPTPPATVLPESKWKVDSYSLIAPFLWLFKSAEQPTEAAAPPEVTPFLAPGEIFINKLLVQDSSFGLVQITGAPTNFLGGFGYSPESYLKVTFDAPTANDHFVEGIAVSSAGAVRVVDATGGPPSGTRYVGGLRITGAGQLCVAIV